VQVHGVFSPRGFFNILVRLYKLNGLDRYKFDLRDSEMILDFFPGARVDPAEIKNLMIKAGYRPGPFKIEHLPGGAASRDAAGWHSPPGAESKSAIVRWLKTNF